MRLRVKIQNAKENQTVITFPDLCIKYSNGFSPALVVKEGEELMLEVLDPEDVRKSLLAGSLKAYLSNGWLEEIIETPKPQVAALPHIPAITDAVMVTKPIQVIHEDLPQTIPPMQEKDKILVEKPSPAVVSAEPQTDLDKVSSYEDFCKVPHLLKLRFIKETKNIELLKSISNLTPSSQFKNNIQLRLSTIH